MLSVCIPVYNVDVSSLVKDLIGQAHELSINIQVLIYDDGSSETFKLINRSICNLKEVDYKELKVNHGSAAIRNKMAADALHNNLLFIDSDSDIQNDYLQKYLPFLSKNKMIVYGGRIHPSKLPSKDKSLRWKVGKCKEDFSVSIRRKVPNKSFMSNNFLAKKQLFDRIKFDDTIERSGHEDTIFGIELEKQGITIIHIDNPVTHIGLESNQEFIQKTEQRLETLKLIEQKYGDNKLLYERITILKYYKKIEQLKLHFIISRLFVKFKKHMALSLLKQNPSMFIYDMYKLGYYSLLSK